MDGPLYDDGRLMNGYDYQNQAWVSNGVYVKCEHLDLDCGCYGRTHEGEMTNTTTSQGVTQHEN